VKTIVLVAFWDLKLSRIFADNKDGAADKWVTDIKRTHYPYGDYDIQLLPVW